MSTDTLYQSSKNCYLSASDEPLLQRDCLDRFRSELQAQGVDEFSKHEVDARYDWDILTQETSALSLFASRRCLILQFVKAAPGREGSRWIQDFCALQQDDVIVFLLMPALDRNAKKSAWVKSLQQQGVVWEWKAPDARAMPAWLQQRAQQKGLKLQQQAAEWLLFQTEGNLLASDQELEKCLLLNGEGEVSREQLEALLSDQARFSPYALAEASLAGQAARAVRILHHLRQEGLHVLALLWPLHRDLARLQRLQVAQQNGHGFSGEYQKLGIWSSHQGIYQTALKRMSSEQVNRSLQQCARVDRCAKGQEPLVDDSRLWEEMLELLKRYTGI